MGAITFSATPAFAATAAPEPATTAEQAPNPEATPIRIEIPLGFVLNIGGATRNIPEGYSVKIPYSYTLNEITETSVLEVKKGDSTILSIPEGALLTVSAPDVPAVQGTFIDSYFSLNGSATPSNAITIESNKTYDFRILLDFISDGTAPDQSPIQPVESDFTPSTENVIKVSSTSVEQGGTVMIDTSRAIFTGNNAAVWLFSTPQLLSSWVVTQTAGTKVVIPASVPAGQHRLLVTDTESRLVGWVTLTVTSAAAVTSPVVTTTSPVVTTTPLISAPVVAVVTPPVTLTPVGNVSAKTVPSELAETGVPEGSLLQGWTLALGFLLAGAGAMIFSRLRATT